MDNNRAAHPVGVTPPRVPTPAVVLQDSARFSADLRTGPGERVLTRVFSTYPSNTDVDEVLTKVVLLNSLFSTNVLAFMAMAEHIHRLHIDPELAAGSPTVVDRIANLPASGRRHYSFATKYCSWHAPKSFPIYDNLVERLLWTYQRHYRFATFERMDLQNYPQYVVILESFSQHFGLNELTFSQIDKFLWYYARELFG
jgi:hypothetical protein